MINIIYKYKKTKGILQMKLTTKLLIIALLALSFFMTEPKNIPQTDTCFTVAEEENTNYEQINRDETQKIRSIDTIRLM